MSRLSNASAVSHASRRLTRSTWSVSCSDPARADTERDTATRFLVEPRLQHLRERLAPGELYLPILCPRNDARAVVRTPTACRFRREDVAALAYPFGHPLDLFRRLHRHRASVQALDFFLQPLHLAAQLALFFTRGRRPAL